MIDNSLYMQSLSNSMPLIRGMFGWTQDDLANKIGITTGALSGIEEHYKCMDRCIAISYLSNVQHEMNKITYSIAKLDVDALIQLLGGESTIISHCIEKIKHIKGKIEGIKQAHKRIGRQLDEQANHVLIFECKLEEDNIEGLLSITKDIKNITKISIYWSVLIEDVNNMLNLYNNTNVIELLENGGQ